MGGRTSNNSHLCTIERRARSRRAQRVDIAGEGRTPRSTLTTLSAKIYCGWFLLARPSYRRASLQNMDSIDLAYVENGSVQWGGGDYTAAAAVADENLDEEPGDERESETGEGRASASVGRPPHREERGVEEEKGEEPEEHRREEATSTEGSNSGGEGGEGREHEEQKREEKERHRRRGVNFATELFFLTHRALQVIVAPLTKRREEAQRILGNTALARTGLALHGEDEGQNLAAAPSADGGVARLQLLVFKEASSAMSLGWPWKVSAPTPLPGAPVN